MLKLFLVFCLVLLGTDAKADVSDFIGNSEEVTRLTETDCATKQTKVDVPLCTAMSLISFTKLFEKALFDTRSITLEDYYILEQSCSYNRGLSRDYHEKTMNKQKCLYDGLFEKFKEVRKMN